MSIGPCSAISELDQRAVRIQVVGVELPGEHRSRPGRADRRDLFVEPVRAARGEHHRRAGSKPARKFGADLTAAAKNQHRRRARVIHGCDYHLR